MRKERTILALEDILLNDGQDLYWLPKDPRSWTQTDIDRTAASIKEDTDFLEDRPLLVTPNGEGKWIVFAGNLRHEGAKAAGLKQVPCVIYYADNDADCETIKRRAMKDNGSFGSWDFDELANSWDDLPLADWGVPVWENDWTKDGLSSKGREGAEGYDEFVDKFKPKLTTDDCYTPPAVFDAVRDFVDAHLLPLKGLEVVRPFYPGGDFTKLDQYGPGKVVIDNPPFSLLSQIVRFYCANSVPFFIFAPALTLFTARDCDVTYIVSDSDIVYENGASVRTGLITNLCAGLRVWCCPELGEMVDAAQPDEDKTKQGFVYPDNIITAAILGKIVKRGVELKIYKESCEAISESDSAKEQGRGLFGGGFILSDHAAAERAAAERAAAERAAAERAAATRLALSDKEKAIIERLNEQDKHLY
jgi:hypothetical protein